RSPSVTRGSETFEGSSGAVARPELVARRCAAHANRPSRLPEHETCSGARAELRAVELDPRLRDDVRGPERYAGRILEHAVAPHVDPTDREAVRDRVVDVGRPFDRAVEELREVEGVPGERGGGACAGDEVDLGDVGAGGEEVVHPVALGG